MEPERKIEKLLRAYAKKRRADAGDAFKVLPATRRRLQGEVERQLAEPPEEDSVSLWQLFRQQWAFLLTFGLVIFLAAALFVPALSKAKMKSQKNVAMTQLKQTGTAAPMTAAENNGQLSATQNAPLTLASKPHNRAAQNQQSDRRAASATVPALAGGSISGNTSDRYGTDKNSFTTGAGSGEALASLSPAPAAQISNGYALALAQPKLLFKPDSQTESITIAANGNSQRFTQKEAGSGKSPQLLATFEIRQNGNLIYVVDHDGSVYEGSLQTGNQALQPASPITFTATINKDTGTTRNDTAGTEDVFFRVAGQNRTSKQNVIFVGHLIPLTTNTIQNAQYIPRANASQGRGVLPQAPMPASDAALINNSRIAGTLTVDTTNQIEINALPASP